MPGVTIIALLSHTVLALSAIVSVVVLGMAHVIDGGASVAAILAATGVAGGASAAMHVLSQSVATTQKALEKVQEPDHA